MGQLKQTIFMPVILIILLFVAIFDGLAILFTSAIFEKLKRLFKSMGDKLTDIAFKK